MHMADLAGIARGGQGVGREVLAGWTETAQQFRI
jgi:hypothetical protein